MIKQLVPNNCEINIEKLISEKNGDYILEVFDSKTINFLNHISKSILSDIELKKMPATVALGFWLRKSNIQQLTQLNNQLISSTFSTQPLGLVFHICPANVDTIFLYSLSISLLIGNKNILKVSERSQSEQLNKIFSYINKAICEPEFSCFSNYISIITYGHEEHISYQLSEFSDARVIWGGNTTVNYFKNIITSFFKKVIIFPDRISFSIFKTATFNSCSATEKKEIIRKFYFDSFTFDQMGCSSPQTIFIYGNETDNSEFFKIFRNELEQITEENYNADYNSISSLKLNQMAEDAISNKAESFTLSSSKLVFANINKHNPETHACGGGYFYIKYISTINEILTFIINKTQTISYFGLSNDEVKIISKLSIAKGADRIVPIGKSLEFNYIWDGRNLFDELSKKQQLIFE